MRKEQFDITGMTCSACSARVEKSVAKLPGIQEVSVNLLKNSMVASYDETALDTGQIVQAVEKAGYGAIPKAGQNKSAAPAAVSASAGKPAVNTAQAEYKQMKGRLLLSALFTIPLFYISMGHMMGWPLPSGLLGMENAITFAFTQFLLLIPVVFVNAKYYRMGFKTLFHGSPNMDSLIAIGSGAAIVYGIYAIFKIGIGFGHGDMETVHSFMMDLYFESAGMILTLITLGKTLEARAKGKTSDAITKLMNLAPKTATVERNGMEQQIPVEQVQQGETLIVKAGESVPVDGVVLEGFSSVDESALAFAVFLYKGGWVRRSPGVPSPEARQRPARSVRFLWRCCLYPAFPLSPKRDRQYTSCPRCHASRSSVRGWNGQEAAHRAALRYATSPFSAENRDRAENGAIWCRL